MFPHNRLPSAESNSVVTVRIAQGVSDSDGADVGVGVPTGAGGSVLSPVKYNSTSPTRESWPGWLLDYDHTDVSSSGEYHSLGFPGLVSSKIYFPLLS